MAPHSTMFLLLSLMLPAWPTSPEAWYTGRDASHVHDVTGHHDERNTGAAFAAAVNTSGLTPDATVTVTYPGLEPLAVGWPPARGGL